MSGAKVQVVAVNDYGGIGEWIGQYRSYRDVEGVAPGSSVETDTRR